MIAVGHGLPTPLRRYLVAACVVIAILQSRRAAAQRVSTDTDIYSNDDLILVNPLQSSAVLLGIIAATTLVEIGLRHYSLVRNRYFRAVYRSGREELTVICLGVLVLQFVVNSFPTVSANWRVVVEWVAVCMVYVGICYCGAAAAIVLFLRLRARSWRTFEWARIEADSHHSQVEQVFKLCRRYFVMEVAMRLQENDRELVSIPPVAFSSFVTLLECDKLKELLSFSLKSWLILGVLVFINGTRSMTVASLDEESTLVTPHIVSYILILGYLVLVLHASLIFFLLHRLRGFTARQLNPAEYDARADAPKQCLLFGSERHTLEAAKSLLLATLWFACVFVMCFAHLAYVEYGALAVLFYLFAAVPPAALVGTMPLLLNLVTFCSALSRTSRDQSIAHLMTGGIVHDDAAVSDDGSDVEEEDAGVRSFGFDGRTAQSSSSAGGGFFLNSEGYDETEYNGPPVLLNGEVGDTLEDTVPGAEEREMANVARYNHFGYERERSERAAAGHFVESPVFFRD